MKKSFKFLILIIVFIILMTNIVFAVPGKVNDSNVRVRSGPSTEGTDTLTNLYLNDPVDVIEKTGDWYKIKTEDRYNRIYVWGVYKCRWRCTIKK